MMATTIISSMRVKPFCMERFMSKTPWGCGRTTVSEQQRSCQPEMPGFSRPFPRLASRSDNLCPSHPNVTDIFCHFTHRGPVLSQLEGLPGAEPADVVAHVVGPVGPVVETADLFHDQAGFGGLGVGDVDRVDRKGVGEGKRGDFGGC